MEGQKWYNHGKSIQEIQTTYAVVDFYNLDSEEMKMAEQMEKYEEVYWSNRRYAKETAREAGLKEGQVLAFLKMNLPIHRNHETPDYLKRFKKLKIL